MVLPHKIIGKFIRVLHSNIAPGEIALGLVLGLFPGLTPPWTLHNAVIVLFAVLLRAHIPAFLLSFALASGFAYLLDPLFHSLGYLVLVQAGFLGPAWTWLYNIPLAPFTRFNNTVVMGSLLFTLVLAVPAFFLFKQLVIRYRAGLKSKVERLRVVQVIRGSRFVQWYLKLKNDRS